MKRGGVGGDLVAGALGDMGVGRGRAATDCRDASLLSAVLGPSPLPCTLPPPPRPPALLLPLPC